MFGDGSVINSASHIKTYIEGTIERLGFSLGLHYLHRIDPCMVSRSVTLKSLCSYHCSRHASWGVDWPLRMLCENFEHSQFDSAYNPCMTDPPNFSIVDTRKQSPKSMPFRQSTRRLRHCTRRMAWSVLPRNLKWRTLPTAPCGHGWLADFAADDFRRACKLLIVTRT